MGNSTTCKIVTPENFTLQLSTWRRRGYPPCEFWFLSVQWGFCPNRRNITTLYFFDCLAALPFFSILRPGRTAGPIFTLYGSNDVFPRNLALLGVRKM